MVVTAPVIVENNVVCDRELIKERCLGDRLPLRTGVLAGFATQLVLWLIGFGFSIYGIVRADGRYWSDSRQSFVPLPRYLNGPPRPSSEYWSLGIASVFPERTLASFACATYTMAIIFTLVGLYTVLSRRVSLYRLWMPVAFGMFGYVICQILISLSLAVDQFLWFVLILMVPMVYFYYLLWQYRKVFGYEIKAAAIEV